MKILLTLIFIFFSQKGFAFVDFTYLICKKKNEILDDLKINENFIFYTFKQGNYTEQLIKINKDKQNVDVFKIINKTGDYNFDDKLITLREKLFFRKIKLKKELNRKSLKLLTYENKKLVDDHNCTIANFENFESKIIIIWIMG